MLKTNASVHEDDLVADRFSRRIVSLGVEAVRILFVPGPSDDESTVGQ
ncbi:hypothetical protein [Skermanella stibiiresistens]|nr:hypothetical protein [Skermanella stibiiresistens]